MSLGKEHKLWTILAQKETFIKAFTFFLWQSYNFNIALGEEYDLQLEAFNIFIITSKEKT